MARVSRRGARGRRPGYLREAWSRRSGGRSARLAGQLEAGHEMVRLHLREGRGLPVGTDRAPDRLRFVEQASRPSDSGHTPFGDIFYSESPDLVHWGRHRHVMGTQPWTWQSTKIGAGPTPIETADGWLVFYHGVLTSCNGFVYSMGAALLDLDEPWKVVARSRDYLMSPQLPYEQVGDVQNVVFPCAALVDAATDRLTIYYGAADTVTCLAHGHLSEVIAAIRG